MGDRRALGELLSEDEMSMRRKETGFDGER
jgi:hypothetical protein